MGKGNFITTFLAFLLLVSMVLAMVFSISAFVMERKIVKELRVIKSALSEKISTNSDRISKLENMLVPNSLFDRYVNAVNYFKNAVVDLEAIFTEMNNDPTTGYIKFFVIGYDPVWITVKKGNEILFSKDLKPGLSPYRFYYFKKPKIETEYTIVIPPDSTIVVGIPGRVYALVFGVSGGRYHPTKVVHLRASRINNLEKDLSLYVPRK